MAISVLMQLTQQLPLYVGMRMGGNTSGLWHHVYFVSLTSLWKVIRRNTIEMIRARRQPKAVPVSSKWRSLLGLLLVGAVMHGLVLRIRKWWARHYSSYVDGFGGTYFVLRR